VPLPSPTPTPSPQQARASASTAQVCPLPASIWAMLKPWADRTGGPLGSIVPLPSWPPVVGWIVKLDKGSPFMGDKALRQQKQRGVTRKLVGFRLDGRGYPRHGYPVYHGGRDVDVVRSGTMSPSLGQAIGTTYLPADASAGGADRALEAGKELRSRLAAKE
jgi:hypothetical protein